MNYKLIDLKTLPKEIQYETRYWRNSESVVKYFQIKYIDETMHNEWLKKINAENPENIAFVILFNGEYIGLTYLRDIADCAKWGIYIHKAEFWGKGIGSVVLKDIIQYAKNKLGLKKIFLDVLKTNARANNLYKKFGFISIFEDDLIYKYELSL